jgi:hypothetical protein
MIVLITGSNADDVGLWSHDSEATIAILTTIHLRLIVSRVQKRPSAWRSAMVVWSVEVMSCWSVRAVM